MSLGWPDGREAALRWLLAFDKYCVMDSGAVSRAVATPPPEESDEERLLRERLLALTDATHASKLRRVQVATAYVWWMRAIDAFERIIDPIDALRRFMTAHRTMLDLRAQVVSLASAADTMQGLYARQKGGWLLKSVLAWRER